MARHETVYIGVVGSDLEYGSARDTIEAIVRRPGDSIQYVRATKGFEARQRHIDAFMATHHDFICLLDQDMVFQPETVAHFRSLNKPYISGFYLRRLTDPIAPAHMLHPEGPEASKVFRSTRVISAVRPLSFRREIVCSAKKVPAGPAPMTPMEDPSGRGGMVESHSALRVLFNGSRSSWQVMQASLRMLGGGGYPF